MAPRLGHVFAPLADRLEAKSMPEPNSGCWLWFGATNDDGYGKVRGSDGRTAYAHRASYELERGPIADGLHLDHKCRNPSCINPAHLEPVTNTENTMRGLAGRLRPERHHCVRGHQLAVHGYLDSQGHRQCRVCLGIRQKAYYRRKTHVQ